MQMVWKEHFVIWITPNFPFHNHSDFAWVIARTAQIKTEKNQLQQKPGEITHLIVLNALSGLNRPGGRANSAVAPQEAIFCFVF